MLRQPFNKEYRVRARSSSASFLLSDMYKELSYVIRDILGGNIYASWDEGDAIPDGHCELVVRIDGSVDIIEMASQFESSWITPYKVTEKNVEESVNLINHLRSIFIEKNLNNTL